jgi:hypothetical protein
MSIVIRLMLFFGLSAASAYAIDTYGFALAHSLEGGVLAFLLSPGIIMIFVHGDISATVSWALFVMISILYYEVIYRLFSRMRRE